MAFDDLLADGQPDTRPRILLPAMQTLEYDKDTFDILLFNPNAIVFYAKDPPPVPQDGADMNPRLPPASELDGVADQVLEQLHQLRGIRLDGRQRIVGDLRAALADG